jgi:hypothetical protein
MVVVSHVIVAHFGKNSFIVEAQVLIFWRNLRESFGTQLRVDEASLPGQMKTDSESAASELCCRTLKAAEARWHSLWGACSFLETAKRHCITTLLRLCVVLDTRYVTQQGSNCCAVVLQCGSGAYCVEKVSKKCTN